MYHLKILFCDKLTVFVVHRDRSMDDSCRAHVYLVLGGSSNIHMTLLGFPRVVTNSTVMYIRASNASVEIGTPHALRYVVEMIM